MSRVAETGANPGEGGGGGGGTAEEQQVSASARRLSIPKDGERVIAPSRRPDGTLRKEIRIRAGYVPQDEVAIYQPKGALLKKAQPDIPPGYNPELLAKPKSKSAKRNEKKKEKRNQAAQESVSDKGKDLEDSSSSVNAELAGSEIRPSEEVKPNWTGPVDSIANEMSRLAVNSAESSSGVDLDKKIRALKKKIRLAESQLQGDPENMKPEQLEKMKKMEGWHEELKILEVKKAKISAS